MNLPPLDVDANIEKVIKEAQKSLGILASHDTNDDNIFTSWMKSKMLQFKLIEKAENSNYYVLTERGWQFESFAKENETALNNRKKLNYDVRNAERIYLTYWWTFAFAVAAFVISLVLLVLKIKELAD